MTNNELADGLEHFDVHVYGSIVFQLAAKRLRAVDGLREALIELQAAMNAMHNCEGLKSWAFRENVEIKSMANATATAALAGLEADA